jgi:hypothetical protein
MGGDASEQDVLECHASWQSVSRLRHAEDGPESSEEERCEHRVRPERPIELTGRSRRIRPVHRGSHAASRSTRTP